MFRTWILTLAFVTVGVQCWNIKENDNIFTYSIILLEADIGSS